MHEAQVVVWDEVMALALAQVQVRVVAVAQDLWTLIQMAEMIGQRILTEMVLSMGKIPAILVRRMALEAQTVEEKEREYVPIL
jgi:hypothetical protein